MFNDPVSPAQPSAMAPLPDVLTYWARAGYGHFVQPTTIPLPDGVVVNKYGWINCPTTNDHIIDIEPVADGRTVYWYSEKIVTTSTAPLRVCLEGSDDGGQTWRTSTGYIVSALSSHSWQSAVPIKLPPGQGMRLHVYGLPNAPSEYHFKFIGVKLPWTE